MGLSGFNRMRERQAAKTLEVGDNAAPASLITDNSEVNAGGDNPPDKANSGGKRQSRPKR